MRRISDLLKLERGTETELGLITPFAGKIIQKKQKMSGGNWKWGEINLLHYSTDYGK